MMKKTHILNQQFALREVKRIVSLALHNKRKHPEYFTEETNEIINEIYDTMTTLKGKFE